MNRPVTCWLMFAGCLALAGFPFTAGFFSKDLILADTLIKGTSGADFGRLYIILGIAGIVTAFLTAYYTFRLWFRVFMGEERWEMGDDHHAGEDGHGHDEHGDEHIEHHHEPHEMPWLMNAPLVILGVGAIAAGFVCYEWMGKMIKGSTALVAHHGDKALKALAGTDPNSAHEAHRILGILKDPHTEMEIISGIIAILGIALAAQFHWLDRSAADRMAKKFSEIVKVLENKYYVDELNDAAIVKPLRMLGNVCFIVDRLVIGGLVAAVAFIPRMLGHAARPAQHGVLQGYGLGMASGVAMLLIMVYYLL